jgi:hypothetical protein
MASVAVNWNETNFGRRAIETTVGLSRQQGLANVFRASEINLDFRFPLPLRGQGRSVLSDISAPARRLGRGLGVYLLPLLHFCACIIIALARIESGIEYMIYVDFPVSVLWLGLGWSHDVLLWCTILGTLWWYLISFAAGTALKRLMATIRNN